MRNLNIIDQAIVNSLNELNEKMKCNVGVNIAVSNKLTFEKWLQIELAGLIKDKLARYLEFEVVLEAPISEKKSKRAQSVDIAILKKNVKVYGIELKILVTNYIAKGLASKTKGITDKVDEMIDDFEKLANDGYESFMSLGFVFPITKDANHRNNIIDFPKHIERLESKGNLRKYIFHFNNSFDVAFLALSNLAEKHIAKAKQQDNSTLINDPSLNNLSLNSKIINLTLGREYYSKGVIAFGVKYDGYLPPKSGVAVNIFLPGIDNPLRATFTRAANQTRRFINGGEKLMVYFKRNYSLGDVIKIEILDCNNFKLVL